MAARGRVVVVGVDFGSSGDAAIITALEQLASGATDTVHVMHVIDPREVMDYPEKRALETEEELVERTPNVLLERVRDLARLTELPLDASRVHGHARLGKPVETLLQTCVDYDADLLIVGTHGRRGLDRMLIGSVAEQLVRSARCPVLVARAKNYAGCVRTALPEPARAANERPARFLDAEAVEHVTTTERAGWHPSDSGPTGFRIV